MKSPMERARTDLFKEWLRSDPERIRTGYAIRMCSESFEAGWAAALKTVSEIMASDSTATT